MLLFNIQSPLFGSTSSLILSVGVVQPNTISYDVLLGNDTFKTHPHLKDVVQLNIEPDASDLNYDMDLTTVRPSTGLPECKAEDSVVDTAQRQEGVKEDEQTVDSVLCKAAKSKFSREYTEFRRDQ